MRTKTSRSTKFNVKFFARVFLKKRYLGTAASHFVFTHKGLSVKRRIGVGVGVFFFKECCFRVRVRVSVNPRVRVRVGRRA